MDNRDQTHCTAFEGNRRIASGELTQVALKTKKVIDRGARGPVLIFDNMTSEQIELDFRGTPEDVLRKLAESTAATDLHREGPRGPGRPKLGVIAREVTLLPRHWEWLSGQSGGASVALRKLVEEARRSNESKDRVRRSREAAYRFMSTMAGNLPGFEEAARALFGGNHERLGDLIRRWPKDIRMYLVRLIEGCAQPEIAGERSGKPTEVS